MSEIVNNKPYKGKIVIHSAVIEEIAMYPNALDALREYISNGWDADAQRIEITIGKNLLKIEDWGTGISNFSRFWGVADQHKSEIEFTPKYKRRPIGRKGLGKLSFSMLGETISVETRTDSSAAYSTANFEEMGYEVFPRVNIGEVLSHTGTQITIRNLKVELKEEDVIKYIKENLYGLILPIACKEHPIKILVNGIKVSPSPFTGIIGSMQTEYGDIHCNLTPTKTAKLDALYRGVKVREVNPAPTHPAKGYFIIDWLVPTPDRSHFVDGKNTKVFFKSIHEWVLKNIPSKNETTPRDLEKSLREVAKWYDQILKELDAMPENMIPTSRTSEPTDLKLGGITEQNESDATIPEKQEQESKQERQRHQHKILKGKEKPLKSAFGINYVFRKEGNLKPAVVPYKYEKLIVINLDHDLIRNINNLPPSQRFMALGFLIARGHFHILQSFKTLGNYDEYVDNMVSMLLVKATAVD